MVVSGALRVLLLCLLSPRLRGAEVQYVNDGNLAQIVHYLQNNYSPGEGRQFAVAVNIPAQLCTGKFLMQNFTNALNASKSNVVKNAMTGPNRTYVGERLIGATLKDDGTKNRTNFHSEYLLLMRPNPAHSHMKILLDRDQSGCAIFYTYNSPCKNTCLNEKSDRCIINNLIMFKGHPGPTAFVYHKLFENDNRNITRKFEDIDIRVPLYRCNSSRSSDSCRRCFEGSNLGYCRNNSTELR
ncbi:uncharacterized protein LOC118827054 [Colossoma macropomum]|uniref:uncharacterized protein LOC118827054 n=1 Tax=Colossoma macropomum TaxID=42526 RepID=UPI0018656B8E|nr:uncharacterized protein LOC118827054 [Colossoma macropomum]